MSSLTRLLLVSVTLSACIASWGCKDSRWGGGESNSSGSPSDGTPFNYTIQHLTFEGRVYLVLVADHCSGGGAGSGPAARGQFHAVDGRNIGWSCTTQDGTSGTLTLDGRQFDLAKGAVFVVSLKENKTSVEQLAVDMSKLQGRTQDEQALADSEPRIAAFFKKARGGK
jgi:hypothetical protein